MRNKFRAAKSKLHALNAQNSPSNSKNKMLLFTSSLCPILTNANTVWSACAKSNLLLLSWFQNSVIRQIYNIAFYISNKQLYREIPTPHYGLYIKKLYTNFHLGIK